MFFEIAKSKAKARLAWVADHPDYEGEGDKVIAALLKQLSEHETAALAEIDRLLNEVSQLKQDKGKSMKTADDFFVTSDHVGLLNYAKGLEFALSQICRTGATGPMGPKGETGPQGPCGATGPSGAPSHD